MHVREERGAHKKKLSLVNFTDFSHFSQEAPKMAEKGGGTGKRNFAERYIYFLQLIALFHPQECSIFSIAQ
jgi:hypothetical protein